MVSLTRDLGLPDEVFPPPLARVGAIGGLAPGDLALEARAAACSLPMLPLERPLIRVLPPTLVTLVFVGLGLIPTVN